MAKGEWAAVSVIVAAFVLVVLAGTAPPGPHRRWIRAAGASALALGLLYLCRSFLPVFIVGLFIAYLLDPLIDRLERRGWRRSVAIAVVFLSFFAATVVAILLLLPPVVGQLQTFAGNIGSYRTDVQGFILGIVNTLTDRVQGLGGDFPETGLPEYMRKALDKLGNSLTETVENALGAILNWLVGSLGLAFSFILLPIISYYFLRDFGPLKAKVKAAIPAAQREKTVATVRAVEAMVGRFLRGMSLVCLAVGITASLVLWGLSHFYGFQYALLVGMFAGLTYAIPFVGAWATIVLGTSVAYFTGDPSVQSAVAVFIALIVINQAFDSLVAPSVVGKSIGLHPLWVIFALLVAGKLFGLAGMLLAWPVAGVIQIIVEQYFRLAEEQTQVEANVEDKSPT